MDRKLAVYASIRKRAHKRSEMAGKVARVDLGFSRLIIKDQPLLTRLFEADLLET